MALPNPLERGRFEVRKADPLKQWKLSTVDQASIDKWDDYTEAKEAMFFNTDTAWESANPSNGLAAP